MATPMTSPGADRPSAGALPPPRSEAGPIAWLRQNLFSSWFNSLLTLVSLWLLSVIGSGILRWVFVTARWDVISVNLRILMVGAYPAEHLWRIWTVVALLSFFSGLSWGAWGSFQRAMAVGLGAALLLVQLLPLAIMSRVWIACAFLLIVAGYLAGRPLRRHSFWLAGGWLLLFGASLLLIGGATWLPMLPVVKSSMWNGLLLTLLLAITGIVSCFPLGVLLALGRQSSLPAIRLVSVAYIELIRGLPLVTILFMAQLMVPLFMPDGMRLDNVFRAFIGITMFSAAYMAENIRGGLQVVPQGQIEAARALGLRTWQIVFFVQLPQALRAVIPAIVGQFISLLKDTSLITIVNLTDLISVGKSVLSQAAFLDRKYEVYVFIALIFFIFCYLLSVGSRRLERVLGVGER